MPRKEVTLDGLTVSNLTRRFASNVILQDLSFSVPPGTVVGVVGPNGAGKTTLLKCIVGTDRPDGGELRFDGRLMDETDPWLRSVVAAALDDIEFFPDLSAAEHLGLLALAHGADPGTVDQVLDELGLAAARDQLPATLSSGQRRRLALASCFVRPRRLLVLDEPEQRLDARGRAWLTDRLQREKAAGVAVLLASHDQSLVDAVTDARIVLGA